MRDRSAIKMISVTDGEILKGRTVPQAAHPADQGFQNKMTPTVSRAKIKVGKQKSCT
jgi:hypothetical protein